MYGKYFAQTFTGSMVGAGPVVHAVWGYCIACAKPNGSIEVNPEVLAAIIGKIRGQDVRAALDYLCRKDPNSRTPEFDGRRLEHVSAFEYVILNYARFRKTRTDEERREYNAEAKRRSRAKQKARSQQEREDDFDPDAPEMTAKEAVQNLESFGADPDKPSNQPPSP